MSAAPKIVTAAAEPVQREIPKNIDFEQAILGLVFKDNASLYSIGNISGVDFYDPLHARLFDTMVAMVGRRAPVTPITLFALMKTDPGVAAAGGQAYFEACQGAAPASHGAAYYARGIAEMAVRRNLAKLGEDLTAAACDPCLDRSPADLLAEAEVAFRDIADQRAEILGDNLPLIDVAAWEGAPIPEVPWAVKNRIPGGNVTLFSGEGAIGKSTVAAQLAAATVLGKDWLGMVPRQGPVVFVSCEDNSDVLQNRFADITAFYGASFGDLHREGLHLVDLVGHDAVFAAPDQSGIIRPTKRFDRVARLIRDVQPSLIILDNSADIYAGNEIDRAQVRQFITLLRQMTIAPNCDHAGLVLTSHPSLQGINNGSGISGSTAWHGSVRGRLYMKNPKPDGGEKPDASERVLEVMKNNYGPAGETISLTWDRGLYLPTEAACWIGASTAASEVDDLFLTLVARFDAQGRNVSHKPTAPTFAPTAFSAEPDAVDGKFKKGAFIAAMARLFNANKIHVEAYGRPSRPAEKIALGARK